MNIEAGSFVSPRAIPQMANSGALMPDLPSLPEKTTDFTPRWSFLIPNLKGLEAFLKTNPDPKTTEVSIFASASEAFSLKNLGRPREAAINEFREVAKRAREAGFQVRGYVSMVIACPYTGPTPATEVGSVVRSLLSMGCYEVSLGDTNGFGTPRTVRGLLKHLTSAEGVPVGQLAGHFHDTYGMGVVNVAAAAEEGVTVFDASVAGLGGCPFAEGAAGNVSTEELVWYFENQGVETGVRLERLVEAGDYVLSILEREGGESRVGRAVRGVRRREERLKKMEGAKL